MLSSGFYFRATIRLAPQLHRFPIIGRLTFYVAISISRVKACV